MKADKIIKNAKIFTADKDRPMASALAVKDGKFVYVGDEAGISEYEGEVTDLGGKFIMPGIIDSHVHVSFPIGFEYSDMGTRFECNGKQEAMDFMEDYIKKNPGHTHYKFMLGKKYLKGEEITKEDLDAICPDAELQIQEEEGHSIWINSKLLERHGITDDTPDPVPGVSYYVRKDGHVTGNIFEGTAEMPIILDGAMDLTDEQIDAALTRWIDYSVHDGVTCVFDSGIPGFNKFHERVYKRLRELDLQGKLPVYVDGCYVIASVREMEEGLKELKRFNREYNTEALRLNSCWAVLRMRKRSPATWISATFLHTCSTLRTRTSAAWERQVRYRQFLRFGRRRCRGVMTWRSHMPERNGRIMLIQSSLSSMRVPMWSSIQTILFPRCWIAGSVSIWRKNARLRRHSWTEIRSAISKKRSPASSRCAP